jgi:hypothetical protein
VGKSPPYTTTTPKGSQPAFQTKSKIALSQNSTNIQYPETSIQDQSSLAGLHFSS